MRAVIADDEAPARRIVRQYLDDFPEVKIVAEATNGIEAEAAVREHLPGLLFLDVQMPGRTGFEVVDALRAAPPRALPRIVFSTAYDQYAVRAFEVAAVDYLLKPYDRARFAEAVQRALAPAEPRADLDAFAALLDERQPRRYPERLLVRDGASVVPVETAEIVWAEAAGDYTTLHATGGRAFLVGQRLGELVDRLDPERFLRVHRSAVVALTALRGLDPDGSGGYHATLVDGTALRVSRSYAPALRDRLV
ncbi:MAG: LytTR family DNA-binding domain-containing protein [Bacteroidota bacterium]